MSDELRAAALIALNTETVKSGYDPWTQSHFLEPKYSEKMRLEAAKKLAEAYLAEHPADDDEPATDDWQMSIGLSEDRVMVEWDGLCGAVITWIDGIDLSSTKVEWNTRRDVRRLLAALGIEMRK